MNVLKTLIYVLKEIIVSQRITSLDNHMWLITPQDNCLIFMILTFVGAGYVLLNHGRVNAGYAVIPRCFCFVFVGVYSGQKKKEKKEQ